MPSWELNRRLASKFFACLIAIAATISIVPIAIAQQQSWPLPAISGVLGTKDSSAVTQITAYIQAASATGWHDLKGSGTLTFPAGDTHTAQLLLLGSCRSRLDIDLDSGTRSLRIASSAGKFQDEKGNQGSLFPETFSAGILAFPRLWGEALGSPQISLRDDGLFEGTAQTLHRITIEYPYAYSSNGPIPTVATDLYFDPSSNLLLLSVDNLRVKENPNKLFQRVTSYGNYQLLSGVLFPTTIQQTVDGQPQWTLQISQVTTNTNPSDSTFEF